MNTEFLTVSDTARLIGVPPKRLTDSFFTGRLPESLCVRVGTRRIIPKGNVEMIRAALENGKRAGAVPA